MKLKYCKKTRNS